jgi:1-acyl-sn-glycerol-3-phosphate acyltransferase
VRMTGATSETTDPLERPAPPVIARPAPTPPRFAPPRVLRVALMISLFGLFFLGSPFVALVLFPLLRVFSGRRFRARATHLLHLGMKLIMWMAKVTGIVGLDLPPPPPALDRSKPYVLISNHPTFIDMIVILGFFPELTCVTNGRWWKHWALGRLLRATLYLPGPGSGLPESEHMLDTMVAHLKAHALLVFPEGQRSLEGSLRRFRRGAVEAASRAGVPIVPLFLAIDRPYLTKQVSIWNAPRVPPTYSFDWLGVIDPAAFDHDAKRIQKHLEAIYDARFSEQRRRHLALAEAQPQKS